jgi:hypothetical protein
LTKPKGLPGWLACWNRLATSAGDLTGENLSQPAGQFRRGRAAEAVEAAVRFQERFLHQVGGVGLSLKPPADSKAGQHRQVAAIVFQQATPRVSVPGPGQRQQRFRIERIGGIHGFVYSDTLVPKRVQLQPRWRAFFPTRGGKGKTTPAY